MTPDRRGGGDFLLNPVFLAAGHATPGLGSTALLMIGAMVLVALALSGRRGGRGRTRTRRGGHHGGTVAYVVLGALVGATVLGATVLRSLVPLLVSAVTALGGLFH